ncbi:Uncharacterized protein dnm_067990 [Desulfonema magnum]|uniref:Uncharacterized protein n=1 Tax=Desulfonema magnum TaxID=45655 RepID=A0A975BSV1_9BACT|nr:Uncharacterized protein dnm_067990 [Desulfonema magnum]
MIHLRRPEDIEAKQGTAFPEPVEGREQHQAKNIGFLTMDRICRWEIPSAPHFERRASGLYIPLSQQGRGIFHLL